MGKGLGPVCGHHAFLGMSLSTGQGLGQGKKRSPRTGLKCLVLLPTSIQSLPRPVCQPSIGRGYIC